MMIKHNANVELIEKCLKKREISKKRNLKRDIDREEKK